MLLKTAKHILFNIAFGFKKKFKVCIHSKLIVQFEMKSIMIIKYKIGVNLFLLKKFK